MSRKSANKYDPYNSHCCNLLCVCVITVLIEDSGQYIVKCEVEKDLEVFLVGNFKPKQKSEEELREVQTLPSLCVLSFCSSLHSVPGF